MMEAPPPMMRASGISRSQLTVLVSVGLGLFLLMMGGVLINMGSKPSGPNPDLIQTWGPVAMDFGLFLLVGGLLLGAAILDDLDVFVRLFLLILAFVALLLILANPKAFFL